MSEEIDEVQVLLDLIKALRSVEEYQRVRLIASASIMLGLVPEATSQLVLHVATRKVPNA